MQLYLTPKTQTTGDFRKRFANPTPLGLMGYKHLSPTFVLNANSFASFVISALTYAAIMMGWGGSTTLTGVA